MKVKIQHYTCGNEGELVTCVHETGECTECSKRRKTHIEEKEINSEELINLINSCEDISIAEQY